MDEQRFQIVGTGRLRQRPRRGKRDLSSRAEQNVRIEYLPREGGRPSLSHHYSWRINRDYLSEGKHAGNKGVARLAEADSVDSVYIVHGVIGARVLDGCLLDRPESVGIG